MKNFKRILALLCVFSLVFSVALSSSAFADEPQYTSTKTFLSYLDSKGVKYKFYGIEDDEEHVRVSYSLDNFSSLACNLYFRESSDAVSLRIWNIVTASAGKNYVLNTLNTIERDYKWVKMVFDESDSTVQAEMDMYIDANHCGKQVYSAMLVMFDVVDYEEVANALHALE